MKEQNKVMKEPIVLGTWYKICMTWSGPLGNGNTEWYRIKPISVQDGLYTCECCDFAVSYESTLELGLWDRIEKLSGLEVELM